MVVGASAVVVTSGRLSGTKASVPGGRIGSLLAADAVVVGSMAAGSATVPLVGVWSSGTDDMIASRSHVAETVARTKDDAFFGNEQSKCSAVLRCDLGGIGRIANSAQNAKVCKEEKVSVARLSRRSR